MQTDLKPINEKMVSIPIVLREYKRFCERYAINTQRQYQRQTRLFVESLPINVKYISQVSTVHIIDYLSTLKRKGATKKSIGTKLKVIRVFFRWVSTNYRLPDSARQIPYPNRTILQTVLSEKEYSKIVANANDEERDILIFIANTGVKVGEFMKINWEDIKDKKIVITNIKNRKRYIPINPKVKKILDKKRKTSLGQSPFKKMSRLKLWRICNGVGKRTGIQAISPKMLRHFFAINLIRSGTPLKTISYLLGHSCIAVTEQIYWKWIEVNYGENQLDSIPTADLFG